METPPHQKIIKPAVLHNTVYMCATRAHSHTYTHTTSITQLRVLQLWNKHSTSTPAFASVSVTVKETDIVKNTAYITMGGGRAIPQSLQVQHLEC